MGSGVERLAKERKILLKHTLKTKFIQYTCTGNLLIKIISYE